MSYARTTAWLLLFSLGLTVPAGEADPIRLPDLGGSSSTVLSPQKEKEVGREIMRSLRRSGQIVDAPFVDDYVQKLGYELSSATSSDAEFTFFVLDDPAINAFTLPGGYIGINAGLIIATRTESELAAVIAHEIAHVTQHHLARSLEEANRMNLPMTAALIAAIVLGRQDPQAAQAAIASAMAGSAQAQLDFTRSHEQEADRVGMGILAQAGFSPEGMPSFFERLYQQTRYSGGESADLEFLRTHPVTVSRIADSRNRAREDVPRRLRTPDPNYEYAKAILKVRVAKEPGDAVDYFRTALGNGEYHNPSVPHLGLALALMELHKITEARAQLALAMRNKEPTAIFIDTQAALERSEGNTRKAETYLKHGVDLYPENRTLVYDFTRLLMDTRRYDEAVNFISVFLRRHQDAKAYALLAEAENARGHSAYSHMAEAEHYYLLDEIPLAIDQLRVARKDPKADFYTLSRIDARLSELRSLLPKNKKRPTE